MLKLNYRVLPKESRLTKTTCKERKIKIKLVNVALKR